MSRAFERPVARSARESRRAVSVAVLGLLLTAALCACASDDTPLTEGVLLDLTVLDVGPTFSGDPPLPIAGLTVCVLDHPEQCANTDSSGRAVLTLPMGERTGVTIVDVRARERIVKKLLPFDTTTGTPFAVNTPAVNRLLLSTLPVVTGQPFDEATQGLLVAQTFYLDNRSLGVDGLVCAMAREDGTPLASTDIWYAPENGAPITTPFIRGGVTSDTGLGGTILPPGVYRVRLDGAYDCAATSGWLVESPDANTWDVPTRAGFFTDLTAYCRKR